MTIVRSAVGLIAVVLLFGAWIAARDALALYREAPGDPMFKLPAGVAIFLIVLAVSIVQCSGD